MNLQRNFFLLFKMLFWQLSEINTFKLKYKNYYK